MAGNVREWSWNAAGDRRYTLGGAWSDPTYLYTGPDALDPMDRSAILGVRCAVYDAPPPEAAFGPIQASSATTRRSAPSATTSSPMYRGYFDYDRRDLDARVEAKDDRPEHWRVEKVSFAAAYGGERVLAYLFLPRNAKPPYQTVVYFPPPQRPALVERGARGTWEFGFLVRSGRAVLFPVYQGTYERRRPVGPGPQRGAGARDPEDEGRAPRRRLPREPSRHRRRPPRVLRPQHGRQLRAGRGRGGEPLPHARPRERGTLPGGARPR